MGCGGCAPCARPRWGPAAAQQVRTAGRRGPAPYHHTGGAAAPEHRAAKDQRGRGLCPAARAGGGPQARHPCSGAQAVQPRTTAAPQGPAGASARPRRAGTAYRRRRWRRPHRQEVGPAVRPVWMAARHRSADAERLPLLAALGRERVGLPGAAAIGRGGRTRSQLLAVERRAAARRSAGQWRLVLV